MKFDVFRSCSLYSLGIDHIENTVSHSSSIVTGDNYLLSRYLTADSFSGSIIPAIQLPCRTILDGCLIGLYRFRRNSSRHAENMTQGDISSRYVTFILTPCICCIQFRTCDVILLRIQLPLRACTVSIASPCFILVCPVFLRFIWFRMLL